MSDLSEQERIKTLDALYTAAASIRGKQDMKLFLKDLLTESERVMLGRRILIARLLLQGETYESIGMRLGASHPTIQRVHRWLQDQFPGYERAVTGLENELAERQFKSRHTIGNTLSRLKRKYPLHFLLFPEPKRKK